LFREISSPRFRSSAAWREQPWHGRLRAAWKELSARVKLALRVNDTYPQRAPLQSVPPTLRELTHFASRAGVPCCGRALVPAILGRTRSSISSRPDPNAK
jgi:hypothetical protein